MTAIMARSRKPTTCGRDRTPRPEVAPALHAPRAAARSGAAEVIRELAAWPQKRAFVSMTFGAQGAERDHIFSYRRDDARG
jgi:hypothetical protein